MQAFLLFLSMFIMVFLLGLQYLNVNRGHVLMAMMTSIGIGLTNLFVLKVVPSDTAGLPELLGYLAGGPIGIATSMWVHEKFVGKKQIKSL